MTFFDEVGKRLNYAVSEVSSRTKEFTAVTKLNTSISAREREIESAYAQIGKLLFEREAADPESPAAALCAKISANREAIDEMRARIVKIKEDQKDARKAKSDELFGKPDAVTVDAHDVSAGDCSCCSAGETGEGACESGESCCCEAAAEAVEAVADTVSEAAAPVAEAVCDAADCACSKAEDAAETVAEKVEGVAQNLSDFYKKREDNA